MGKVKPNPLRRKTRSLAERESSMQRFVRFCKCNMHGVFKKTESPRIFRISSRKYSLTGLQWLRDQNYISSSAKFVCTDCLSEAPSTSKAGPTRTSRDQSEKEETEDEDTTKSKESKLVDDVISLIKNGTLSQECVQKLCFSMGTFLSSEIMKDIILLLSGICARITTLCGLIGVTANSSVFGPAVLAEEMIGVAGPWVEWCEVYDHDLPLDHEGLICTDTLQRVCMCSSLACVKGILRFGIVCDSTPAASLMIVGTRYFFYNGIVVYCPFSPFPLPLPMMYVP